MDTVSYTSAAAQLETYFDRTAAEAWSRLTSDAPVERDPRHRARRTRPRCARTLLELAAGRPGGMRLLDAGCGTGALAVEAAQRGAEVTAIDLSPTLVGLARERLPAGPRAGRSTSWSATCSTRRLAVRPRRRDGFADPLQRRTTWSGRWRLWPAHRGSLVFTFAPRTPALAAHARRRQLFPRGDRAPAIEPVAGGAAQPLGASRRCDGWRAAARERIASGFYTSQALELVRR